MVRVRAFALAGGLESRLLALGAEVSDLGWRHPAAAAGIGRAAALMGAGTETESPMAGWIGHPYDFSDGCHLIYVLLSLR